MGKKPAKFETILTRSKSKNPNCTAKSKVLATKGKKFQPSGESINKSRISKIKSRGLKARQINNKKKLIQEKAAVQNVLKKSEIEAKIFAKPTTSKLPASPPPPILVKMVHRVKLENRKSCEISRTYPKSRISGNSGLDKPSISTRVMPLLTPPAPIIREPEKFPKNLPVQKQKSKANPAKLSPAKSSASFGGIAGKIVSIKKKNPRQFHQLQVFNDGAENKVKSGTRDRTQVICRSSQVPAAVVTQKHKVFIGRQRLQAPPKLENRFLLEQSKPKWSLQEPRLKPDQRLIPVPSKDKVQSDAYIKYIKSLENGQKFTTHWEHTLKATKENTPISHLEKLPKNWLANGSGNHGSIINALWALRDYMTRDQLGLRRVSN